MSNKAYAKEWLTIAYHDLKSAETLYNVNHFTDSIGSDLQQSIEKILKSILAYHNEKIIKTHNLVEVYAHIDTYISLGEDELVLLEKATRFLQEDRYPNPRYTLPARAEIKDILDFTTELFSTVCELLGLDESEVKQ